MNMRLGHYDIVEELGRGGMGVVYKGFEASLGRFVAIKALSATMSHDKVLVERFLREARSMASLNDPHIIQIYFIGQENNQPFFVMEFVEGESLSSAIKNNGRLAVGDSLKILHQTAQGLSIAHDRGVIHRDIKPANLMLNQRGQVKIADFGIALANRDFDSKLTGTGEFVGTPGYLSPEVCLGKPVDQRSDIFALGIVLFESLTGRTPFSDESPLKLMLDVVQSEIPDVRELNTEVDPDVARILGKMLAKDPANRYQSTHELIADLEKHPLVAQGGPLKLKPAMPSGPAATLIGMATPVTPGVGMRAPTPPPSVSSTPAPVSAPTVTAPGITQPGVTQPSAVSPARSKTPAMIGVLALLLVAGLAWAFRAPLFGVGKPADAGVDSAAPASPLASAPAPATVPVPPPADASNAAVGASTATQAPAPVPTAAPAPPSIDTAATQQIASIEPAPNLRERIAERREQRVENAAPRGHTFAIEASGDPALVIPAQQLIEDKLSGAGFQQVGRPALAAVVVKVRAEVIGSQNINFYGQSATLTTAYLSVRPFGHAGRPLGVGVREKIDYTPLNAEDKVKEALEGKLDRLSNSADGQQ